MIFQSKYRNHKLLIKPTRRMYHPGMGIELIPGLRADFRGSQRIFDSEAAQRTNNWTDEQRNEVEDYVLSNREYGRSIFLGPGQTLPEDKEGIVRVKPKIAKRRCLSMAIVDGEVGPEISQCPKEAAAGRDYCFEHDPDEAKAVRGLSTTAG